MYTFNKSEVENLLTRGHENFNRISRVISESSEPSDDKSDWTVLLDLNESEERINRFYELDTISRDHLLFLLKDEFCYITKSEMKSILLFF